MKPEKIIPLLIITALVSATIIANGALANSEDDGDKGAKCTKIIDSTQIVSLALNYLETNYGKSNYILSKISLEDSKYELTFMNSTHIIELKINACNGIIIGIALESIKEPLERVSLNQTEIINIAISFLKSRFGNANYTILELELHGSVYELKITDGSYIYELNISGKNGSILSYEVSKLGLEHEEQENATSFGYKIIEKKSGEGLMVKIEKRNAVLQVHYVVRSETNESALNLILNSDKLIEFIDSGSIKGAFDKQDQVVSFVDLHSLNWKANQININDTSGNLVEIRILQEASLGTNGNITLVYHITPSVLNLSSLNINAKIYRVKLDIIVKGFPWRSSNSLLAFQAHFNANFEREDLDEMKVEFKGAGNVTPFFSWGGTAVADGKLIKVNATLEGNTIYLTYPHFNYSLEHDPIIGYLAYSSASNTSTNINAGSVSQTSPLTSTISNILRNLMLIIISVFLLTAIIGLLIYRSRRIKKEID